MILVLLAIWLVRYLGLFNSEWIMWELGVFSYFLENDLSKVDKILGLTFLFKARKDWRIVNVFFPFSVADFFARCNVYNSRLFAYKRPGVGNRFKIGKSYLIDIDCIYQSVEIDDTLLSFIDLYRKIHLFFCSSKNENWFHANRMTIELQLRVERSNNLLSLFKKKKLKKSYLFLNTRFISLLLMAEIGQICRRPVFHDLDLPPFQNNISSACSYLAR